MIFKRDFRSLTNETCILSYKSTYGRVDRIVGGFVLRCQDISAMRICSLPRGISDICAPDKESKGRTLQLVAAADVEGVEGAVSNVEGFSSGTGLSAVSVSFVSRLPT
jgi:hypothetical protein